MFNQQIPQGLPGQQQPSSMQLPANLFFEIFGDQPTGFNEQEQMDPISQLMAQLGFIEPEQEDPIQEFFRENPQLRLINKKEKINNELEGLR